MENKIKDYVLLMLGAPVVKVELTEEQLNHCVDTSYNAVINAIGRPNDELVKMGALAHAKHILGRIRGKYEKIEKMQLDGAQLTKESLADMKEWKRWLELTMRVIRKFDL